METTVKTPIIAFLAVAGLITAGCSQVKVIDTEYGQNYYDGAFEFATMDGSLKTAVVGSPFAAEATNEFAKSVTGLLKNATFGRDVTFVPAPRNLEKNAFHSVIVFNGVQPFTEREMCENDVPIKTRASRAQTSMHAVFCHGKFPISYSSGFALNLAGPADPDFQILVRAVAQAMIPRYDDFHSSGSRRSSEFQG